MYMVQFQTETRCIAERYAWQLNKLSHIKQSHKFTQIQILTTQLSVAYIKKIEWHWIAFGLRLDLFFPLLPPPPHYGKACSLGSGRVHRPVNGTLVQYAIKCHGHRSHTLQNVKAAISILTLKFIHGVHFIMHGVLLHSLEQQ